MANTTTDRVQMEAAARGLGAKLQAFRSELTPDEQALLQVALGQLVAQATEDGADTSGYLTPMHLPLVSVRIAQEVNTQVVLNQIREIFGLPTQ